MGNEAVPASCRLTLGVIWSGDAVPDLARGSLNDLFGPILRESEAVPLGRYTAYYEREMGPGLSRCFWVFADPFPMGGLQEAKLATNRLERVFSENGKRRINLDPGLLSLDSLVLATTKPYFHRIYLSKGIYAELELVFKRGRMESLPWTYPDYGDVWAMEFFLKARNYLLQEMRKDNSDS